MEPQNAPALDYVAVADPLPLPAGMNMGAAASVAFDSKGHLFVLYRGTQALVGVRCERKVYPGVRAGFQRTHGLRIDRDRNIWVTDVGAHIVVKMNPQGQILLTLGTKGEPGEWNEATQSHRLNEPNEIAINRSGDMFIVQGHTPGKGDPRVLKFDKSGNFKKSGRFGDGAGQVQRCPRNRNRRQRLALGGRPREPEDSDLRRRRKVHQRDQVCGIACGLNIGDSTLYGKRFRWSTAAAGSGRKSSGAIGKPGKGVGESAKLILLR